MCIPEISTITYRSGPEWEQRFARHRRLPVNPENDAPVPPALCPDFLIETYLDHQGEQFCLKYDANSLLYISKAMDLFDMSIESLQELQRSRTRTPLSSPALHNDNNNNARPKRPEHISSIHSSHSYLPGLAKGLSNLSRHPTLILGAQSDILFPIDQQREIAEALRMNGNKNVTYYELDSPYGHDTCECCFFILTSRMVGAEQTTVLIDLQGVGGALSGFLSSCTDAS